MQVVWWLCAACFIVMKQNTLDSLAFQNIEALAQSENDAGAYCYGIGSVDCRGHKVEYKISGYSLE